MQKVVFEEPYEFIPPYRGKFWSWAVGKYLPRLVRQRFGVQGWKTFGLDYLRDSLENDYGILICPNHCRASDPILTGAITTGTPCHAYAMASWHVFKQNWLEAFVCHRIGAFSVYREGLDRKALDLAVEIVTTAERPLVIFPEGVISGANDRLMTLMDGVSFVARTATKKRVKKHPESKVVVHPVAFRYQHQGDPEELLAPVVSRLEDRMFGRAQTGLPILDRIKKVRHAIQVSREVHWLDDNLSGEVEVRMHELANLILQKHEAEWLGRKRVGDPIVRVKDLRIAILADMVAGKVTDEERQRRWKHLEDLYYAQCFSLHVPGYLDESVSAERLNHHMFETVERLEEELTDVMSTYGDLDVEVHVGEAIEVDPAGRKPRNGDPLMIELREKMLGLLGVNDQWLPEPVADCENGDVKENRPNRAAEATVAGN